ncbi:hypothetical protein MRB53_036954 [Persea americana]|nr:hypothetical protein MRB53_036954 [Persea americana]
MTTASPIPLTSQSFYQHPDIRATRPALSRHTRHHVPLTSLPNYSPPDSRHQQATFQHSTGFSAGAAMIQDISYGAPNMDDSSDDDLPPPMHFSAYTQALLKDDRGHHTHDSPREGDRRRKDMGRSVHEERQVRGPTPPRGTLRIRRLSPEAQTQAGDGSPRIVQLHTDSGRRGAKSAMSSRHDDDSRGSPQISQAYKTPAYRSRSQQGTYSGTTTGASASDIQSRGYSGSQKHSSGLRMDAAAREELLARHEEEMQNDMQAQAGAHDSALRDTHREPMPGSMRVRRIALGTGTLLRGAPMRRTKSRRQSEEEPNRSDYENEAEEQVSDMREVQAAAAQEHIDVYDLARETQRMKLRATASAVPPIRTSPMLESHQAVSRPQPDHVSRSPPAQMVYRVPPAPSLPAQHDQENDPPPTFKRNKPLQSIMLGEISKPRQLPGAQVLDAESGMKSPARQALASRDVNTPHRSAPPPPKMTLPDATAAKAGASTTKKKKRSLFIVNGKQYSMHGRIGKGGSSDVYRVMAENDKMYALKRVNLADCGEEIVRGYKGEIDLLKKLEKCDRVVRLFDWEVNEQKQTLSVLMEIGELDLNSMLNTRLHRENAKLDLAFTRHYWREMLSCLAAVHSHDIVHSDLKPANFLLVQGRLKLIDFGIADSIDTDNTVNVHRESTIGTPNYMSPESLQDASVPTGQKGVRGAPKLFKIGKPSDVWSLGCMLYQMVYGRPPFAHISSQWARVSAIQNNEVPITYAPTGVGGVAIPDTLKRLLQRCLDRDPSRRLTVEEMLAPNDAFLNPDLATSAGSEHALDDARRYRDVPGAVPVTEEMLARMLAVVVARCRDVDGRKGALTDAELAMYPRALLEKVRASIPRA